MRIKRALPFFALLLASSAFAADSNYHKLSDLLASDEVKEILQESGITLYWVGTTPPAFREYSLPDSYTRPSISLSPFGGARRHCVESFEKTLKAMVEAAQDKGYDAIVDLAPVVDDRSRPNADGFTCNPGYKVTLVTLIGRFALSDAAAKRVADEEQASLKLPPRQPAKGAIFLPLEPVLNSPAAKAILGQNLSADWHFPPPPYVFRNGQNVYSAKADITEAGSEAACNRAVLNALKDMAEEAASAKYDQIIKIRSYLDEAFAPDVTQYECAVSRRSVSVSMQASLATKN